MSARPVLELFLGDVIRLRRAHPCGGSEWRIDRLGADIGLRCQTCGRHVLAGPAAARIPPRWLRRPRRPGLDRGGRPAPGLGGVTARDRAGARSGARRAGSGAPERRKDPVELSELAAPTRPANRAKPPAPAESSGDRPSPAAGADASAKNASTAAVLRNRPFLLLWLSQLATQIGVNMVLYALTVIVLEASNLSSVVSALFLTFLVPSVLFSALAGVYVDRVDRRLMLVVTNALRAAVLVGIFAVGGDIFLVLVLNTLFSIVTVFFAPAEAAMIPVLVPRHQLVAANGLFTLTLNGAFALGYALLGPLIVTLAGGPQPLIVIVGGPLRASPPCSACTLPADPPAPRERSHSLAAVTEASLAAVTEAGPAVTGVFGQLREGIRYIRDNPAIAWSLAYLGISASLIGVVAVLGPSFARDTLGLAPKDLIVVVLPLGIGIVMGVLILNNYGRLTSRAGAPSSSGSCCSGSCC